MLEPLIPPQGHQLAAQNRLSQENERNLQLQREAMAQNADDYEEYEPTTTNVLSLILGLLIVIFLFIFVFLSGMWYVQAHQFCSTALKAVTK